MKEVEEMGSGFWRFLRYAAPRELYLVYLLKYLESYSYFALSYTLILFLSEEFSMTDETAGLVYGIQGLLISFYGFLMATVVDSVGVKWSVTFGMLLLFFARCALVVTESVEAVLLNLFVILPAGTSLGVPVLQIGVKRLTQEKDRVLAYSIFYVIMNVAAVTAAPLVDFFRQHYKDGLEIFPDWPKISAFRLLILSGALLTFASLFVALTLLSDLEMLEDGTLVQVEDDEREHCHTSSATGEEQVGTQLSSSQPTTIERQGAREVVPSSHQLFHLPTERDEQATSSTTKSSCSRLNRFSRCRIQSPASLYSDVFRSPRFWRFFLLVCLLLGVRVVFRYLDALFPKYLIREIGPGALYGSVIALDPLLILVLVPALGMAAQNVSSLQMIFIGSCFSAAAPFWLSLGHSYANAVLFITTLAIGEACWSPRLYEYTMRVAEPGREGTYTALANAPTFCATLIAGSLSGFLLDTFVPDPALLSGGRGLEDVLQGSTEMNKRNGGEKMWFLVGLMSLVSPLGIYFTKDIIDHDQGSASRSAKNKIHTTSAQGNNLQSEQLDEHESMMELGRAKPLIPSNRKYPQTSAGLPYPSAAGGSTLEHELRVIPSAELDLAHRYISSKFGSSSSSF